MEKYGDKYTILVPALPVNKRVVSEGILYVDGIPLHMSHMKDHPLTPMWESDIAKLMEPQAKYESFKVNKEMLKESKEDILEKLDEFGKTRKHFYVIPDFVEDEDARKIVEVFGDLKVLTGGSGLMTELAKRHGKNATRSSIVSSKTKGPALILAGSSSKATLGQVVHFIKSGKKALRMEPLNLIDGSQTIDDIWNFVVENKDEDILIYSSASPDEVKKNQEAGRERVASLLENTTALIAKRAAKNGFNRIIVAGGETSGAVTKSLGFDAYIIGESVAPGVPIMVPLNNRDFRLVLKSGNFGQEDFFIRALEMTGE
ncbi:MAG: four-carbon acid sugar kinase family protein [Clostridiales bacterium]|nr:four-carbon acid sugar kinase family protein [Clostridiales bacterium]